MLCRYCPCIQVTGRSDEHDAELAELDANVARRVSRADGSAASGVVNLGGAVMSPTLSDREPSPVDGGRGGSPRGSPTKEMQDAEHAKHVGASAKPGGCCSMS